MEAEKQRLVAQKFEQKARTGDVMIQEKTTFSGLMLAPEVLEGLSGAGFEVPSPIQLQAIPLGRAGLDLIVQAKSGTGKTCVFTVIALESIDTENTCMQVVILAPTREIAVQIWEVIKSIGRTMEKLRCYVFIGGLNVNDDKLKLKKCHIAVATPGRFRQLIEMDAANVNSVRLFVLDEADKLLEAGFQDDINWIYSALPMNKQMIAASATYPEYLAQQLTTYMRSPKMIRLNTCDPALLGISQYYVLLPFSSLPYKVYEEKSEFLLRLLSSVDFQQCLVFSNYQSRAQSLSKLLDSKGWPSTFICGSQEQEKRLTAMAKLRRYQCRVLISTDLTSRGIDVENVNLVVNLDLPADHETYLHRIGRAGRYGSFGAAVTLVTQGKESANLRLIEVRCQTSIQLLPDPIPEGLTHSCPKVDLTVEVTVEEALPPCHSPDGPQVKLYEEAEDIFVHDEEAENIFVHGISDAGGIKWTEQEFILNNSTGHEDHTTGHIGHEDATMGHEDHTTGHIGHEDHTTMHEDHATGQAGHSPGHEDHTIGHEGHTTGHKEHTAGHEDHKMWHEDHTTSHEDHTTVHEDHTTGHEEHTAEHKEHTAKHEDHTTWHEDHTTRHEDHITRHEDHTIGHEEHTAGHKEHTAGHEDGHGDHTTGYDEMSVKSSEKQAPTPGINSNDSLNVDVLSTSDIQDEGKTMNEDKGFAVRIELTKKQYSSAFKTGESNTTVHNPKSGEDFDTLKKTGIVDNLCENEINASEENRIDSFTADDDRGTNSDGVLSGSAVNGVEYGDMKINVNNSNKQSNPLDELPTIQIEPRSDHVKESLNWCSLVKETLPVSDQVLYSLGDLVSMSRSHVLEKDGAGEASESVPGPKWAAEDVPEPADESVFEDVGRLIADSDYGYATRFPCSATLLGDNLELDGMTFVSLAERRVILSGGDAALQKPSTEERLPSVEASVDRSAGDAFPLNFSGEERLPSGKDLRDAASAEKECTLEKEKTLDLQAIPKSCSMSSGRVHQEAQTCRRVKWSRDKLLSMERLADNVVIAPDVARLVQELCIERGCENAARGDTWERRGNAARGGRPGSKFGSRKQNYGSNRREPLSSVSAVSSDTAPIGTSSSMRSSSYSTAEAAAPSVPPEDSIDAKYPASSKSNYRMTEAIEASAVWVPGSHSNDLASTLIPPTDSRLCTASLTSEAWHSRADTIVVRSTASPAMSCYLSMASASPVNPPVGCIDTRGTATLTPSIQKTCDMSSKTYSSGGYQVSDHFDICHSITEDAGMRSPSNHLQSDQTFSTTVCDEPSTTAPSPPLSNSGKHSPESDKPLQSTSFQPDAGNGASEPEYRPAMSVFRPEHQQTPEESCGAILSYPAHSEFSSIPNIKDAICETLFLETYQGNNGKFSELPCDGLASPRPEPFRVADDADNETLGRDYMLKLSACRDVIESSSDFSYATESGFQDDAGGLFWKPSAKQTRKKSAEKKQHRGSRARNQARQGQPTREHKERCRTAKAENFTSEETCHIASGHEVHKSHRLSHNDFVEQQAFQGGTRHKIHSCADRASARGIPNSRDSTDVKDSIPQQDFPGYSNLDAYTSYYWNSYMSHLYDAEHFRQLLTSLADQTRLQDIAVQQAAYIQHMIAFHRTL